ncbi:MAG TPA: ABC transporter ATP-binding protein [Candidatus Desulfaltia sp.]|nr:ABC transporter ATP-binding protein [Candidatus Desulfaltia sp.]
MIVEVSDLQFSYGRSKALDGITLRMAEGAVGLLGPNGAGKSTLLRILLGFLVPQQGRGRVLGYDIRLEQPRIRRHVGYMPEDDCLIPGMDAVTFTAHFGELSGMPRQEAMRRAHDVLFYVGLGESRYRPLESYSAGMKQRLKLAQAIVHDPKLLFLDEPTSNLDPQGRKEVLELIRDISSKKEIQVLVSSHILSDIESVCSDVVILNKGRLAAQGKLSELRTLDYRLYEVRIKGEGEGFTGKLKALGCRVEETADKLLKVYMPANMAAREILATAEEVKVQVRHFVRSRTSLEDFFAQTVGVD